MDTDEDKLLKGASSWQYRPRRKASSLGDEVVSYMQKHDRAFTKNAIIVDLWNEVIPPSLQPFCRLDKRVGNTLYIQAAPGPYGYEIKSRSSELLDRIKQLAPRCGIQKIRVSPLQKNDKEYH